MPLNVEPNWHLQTTLREFWCTDASHFLKCLLQLAATPHVYCTIQFDTLTIVIGPVHDGAGAGDSP